MSRFSIVILSLMFLAQATATGNCRDGVCSNSPSKIGDSCQCWSTCNSVDDARKCDGASSLWSGYQRANQGGNDVGCTYIPFASNQRDLCVWYYSGNTADDAAVTTL